MANYKIADTTLTSIGDAIRGKVGETRVEQVPVENPFHFSFNTKDYDLNEFPNISPTMKKITIPIEVPKLARSFKFQYSSSKRYINDPDIKRYNSNGTLSDAKSVYTSSSYSIEMNLNAGEYLVFEQTYGVGSIDVYRYEINGEFYFYDNYNNLITYDDVDVRNVYTPLEMAQAINDMPPAPAEDDLVLTGNCSYRFANDGWDWALNKYGDRMKTRDITNSSYMFYASQQIEEIPFEINFILNTSSGTNLSNMFKDCKSLKSIPKLNNVCPQSLEGIFNGCLHLRNVPEDIDEWFDWSWFNKQTSAYNGNRGNTFTSCFSLRKLPIKFLKHGNPYASYSSSSYYYLSNNCYVLDEIVNLPVTYVNATWTSNAFTSSFTNCYRLKNLTFALQEDGTPYSVKWKSQTIDLSNQVGYISNSYSTPLANWSEDKIKATSNNIINYNSGITIDKCIHSDETYNLLKDDEDAFCLANYYTSLIDYGYSRYNHDSAVNTINSLPDTSAYLATAGGTNTIKFRGSAGSKTDGGAINTLTAEEIAVASSKGWTVSFA